MIAGGAPESIPRNKRPFDVAHSHVLRHSHLSLMAFSSNASSTVARSGTAGIKITTIQRPTTLPKDPMYPSFYKPCLDANTRSSCALLAKSPQKYCLHESGDGAVMLSYDSERSIYLFRKSIMPPLHSGFYRRTCSIQSHTLMCPNATGLTGFPGLLAPASDPCPCARRS